MWFFCLVLNTRIYRESHHGASWFWWGKHWDSSASRAYLSMWLVSQFPQYLCCAQNSFCTCAAEILNRQQILSYSWPFLKCRHPCPLPQGVSISERDKLSWQKTSFTNSYLSWAIHLACNHHHISHTVTVAWAPLLPFAAHLRNELGSLALHGTATVLVEGSAETNPPDCQGCPHLGCTPANAEISGPQCHGTAYLLNSNTMS